MRLPILSKTGSGVIALIGKSVAGAPNNVLVVGCGESMLGSSFSTFSSNTDIIPFVIGAFWNEDGRGDGALLMAVFRGPVLAAEGRICSNPCEAATASMDLKYWLCQI